LFDVSYTYPNVIELFEHFILLRKIRFRPTLFQDPTLYSAQY
jgi:hypothetical protein